MPAAPGDAPLRAALAARRSIGGQSGICGRWIAAPKPARNDGIEKGRGE